MASTIVSGAKVLSVWNPNASGSAEVVQIEARHLYEVEANKQNAEPDQTSPTGGSPYAGDDSSLSFETSDHAGKSQLDTWAKNDTPVSAVIIGYQDAFQWYEEDIIDTNKVPIYSEGGQLQGLRMEMNRIGHGEHAIHDNADLLRFAGWRGSDGDNDGVPDEYTNDSFTSVDFTDADSDSTEEQFEGYAPTGGGEAALYIDVVLPVSGIELTLSALFNQLHDDGTTYIELQTLDYSDTVLQTETTTVSSTGRDSVTLSSTHADTYTVRCKVVKVDGASANTSKVQVADPALRVDGETAFIQY